MWHFGRAGTCRGDLHLPVALGLPGREVCVGRLAAVPFGCPHLQEGTGGCLSLCHLPLSACCSLPALGQAAGASILSWATARIKSHAAATRLATGMYWLGWVLGSGMKRCSAQGSLTLGSLLWARDILLEKGQRPNAAPATCDLGPWPC